MKTLEEVLGMMQRNIGRAEVEHYIARQWVRPRGSEEGWYFEEIDIARLELICHLARDIEINEQGMDVALSLLDQLYGMRAHVNRLTQAIARQSPQVQAEIRSLLSQLAQAHEEGD